MASSTAVRARKSKSGDAKKRDSTKKKTHFWNAGSHAFWPLLLCLILDPFIVRFADVLALEGPKIFSLLYPWIMVVNDPVLHLSSSISSRLTQWLLYLQFPLYGVLMTVTFRAERFLRAFCIGLAAHFSGLLVIVAFSHLR
ncbi:MAG TPA: hypothetical protein VMD25_10260 [Acidobacteriaceae bacterium]|nr:hypothetical protein [Acidobacteriaceae bacterium]